MTATNKKVATYTPPIPNPERARKAAESKLAEAFMARQMSVAEQIALLSEDQREAMLNEIAPTPQARLALNYDWDFWVRPSQRAPEGDWFGWCLFSGRGYGKTRVGSEWVIRRAQNGPYYPIALVGQTKADVRDTMAELFESSILQVSPPWFTPKLETTKRRISWPNGMVAIMYSGDEPDQLRGPQHGGAWVDELAKFKYPDITWSNLMLGLRLGATPQVIVTTTPRPIPIIMRLLNDAKFIKTYGSSYDNLSNLAPAYIDQVLEMYLGTRLGQQEIEGKILMDVDGALWNRDMLEQTRVFKLPSLTRIVVGVDPPTGVGVGALGNATGIAGIVVVGKGQDGHGYVLDDRSVGGRPEKWARAVVEAYHAYQADEIIAESNQGGDMVRAVIHTVDNTVPVRMVHASRGKDVRAQPVSSLYERKRVHHVGLLADLEDQLVSWIPGEKSPDRLDALVWACTRLLLGAGNGMKIERVAQLFNYL